MEDGEDIGGLDADATAYFESRGETTEPAKVDPPNPAPSGEIDTEAQHDIEGAQKDRMVPIRAVTRERDENKALRSKIEEMERRSAVLEDRWNTMLSLGQQPQQQEQPPAPPDPEQDIFAFSKWQAEQLKALQTQVQTKDQAEQQATEARRAEKQVWDLWESDTRAFAATPEGKDFGDAATWLANFRDNQLSALSTVDTRFADKRARDAQMNDELKQIVIAAAQQGKSPAQAIYAIAKGYGYTGPKPAANADPGAAIEKIAKNADAEISLSNMGGAPASKGAATAEDIANMSPADFDAWFKKHGENGFRRLAGGRA